jgi:hypothetical protein
MLAHMDTDCDWLPARLAPYGRRPGAPLRPGAFRTRPGGLRARIDALVDDAARRFEVDRLLYEVEVEATARWLDRLAAFDAYCAARDR